MGRLPAGAGRMSTVLELSEVTFRRDGRQIIDGISPAVRAGERWALLGPSGAGKSTLTTAAASAAFDHPVEVRHEGSRRTARSCAAPVVAALD